MIRLKIKEVAQARKISQGRLSHLSFVDTRTLRRIYSNPTGSIQLDTLNRIAMGLHVHPCDLFEFERDTPWPPYEDEQQ